MKSRWGWKELALLAVLNQLFWLRSEILIANVRAALFRTQSRTSTRLCFSRFWTLLASCGSAARSFGPAGSAVWLQSLKVFKKATTDGLTHLWGLSSAASPRPKSWVWMARSDVAAAGSKGSVVPHTEAALRLKEAPRRRGTEGEADQTREADWEGKQR